MNSTAYQTPEPKNEPNTMFEPGSPERASLKKKLEELSKKTIQVPMVIGGKKVRTGDFGEITAPHDHELKLCRYHKGGAKEVDRAINAALKAKEDWAHWHWEDRLAIFMKAADLIAGPYRDVINASTMLGQSKSAFQAEIDASCELIDFLRFNVSYVRKIMEEQPFSPDGIWNRVDYRALDGFVFAVTPFNFTAIGGNLPTAPAMVGNTVVWKPASTQVYSAHFFMEVLLEAGLPDGVINMVLGKGSEIGKPALAHPDLAGIHFTGSTKTFQTMWKTIGGNIENYNAYPRIVGETGGKDFVVAHKTADLQALTIALVRGAFEYQGQKCSAASRAYIPKSLWPKLQKNLEKEIATIKMGDVKDFTNFVNAVIDKSAFDKIKGYIDHAKRSKFADVIIGGKCDDTKGYFIEPTVILAKKPDYQSMVEEIFGPVLTIYLYPDNDFAKVLELCDKTSPYGLTGAIFSQDRAAIVEAEKALRFAAGNFYINDKPTGSIVGQQPFGGSRYSGTNDKAGSAFNIMRWISPRAVKETFVPPTSYRYPFMDEE